MNIELSQSEAATFRRAEKYLPESVPKLHALVFDTAIKLHRARTLSEVQRILWEADQEVCSIFPAEINFFKETDISKIKIELYLVQIREQIISMIIKLCDNALASKGIIAPITENSGVFSNNPVNDALYTEASALST